ERFLPAAREKGANHAAGRRGARVLRRGVAKEPLSRLASPPARRHRRQDEDAGVVRRMSVATLDASVPMGLAPLRGEDLAGRPAPEPWRLTLALALLLAILLHLGLIWLGIYLAHQKPRVQTAMAIPITLVAQPPPAPRALAPPPPKPKPPEPPKEEKAPPPP